MNQSQEALPRNMMPTRKEILEALNEQLGELSVDLCETSEVYREHSAEFQKIAHQFGLSVDELRNILFEHGNKVSDAAKSIDNSVNNISDEITTGLVGGGIILALGAAIFAGVKATKKYVDDFYNKGNLIDSIVKLQKTHGDLTYEFIIERAFVKGLGKSQIQQILNELIHEDMVDEKVISGISYIVIDENAPSILEFRKRFEDTQKELLHVAANLKKQK